MNVKKGDRNTWVVDMKKGAEAPFQDKKIRTDYMVIFMKWAIRFFCQHCSLWSEHRS